MVLLFRNDDLPILYMVLTLRNDVSKFDDFTLHDVFVSLFDVVLSFFDVVIPLLDEVKPRDQFGKKYVLFLNRFQYIVCLMCFGWVSLSIELKFKLKFELLFRVIWYEKGERQTIIRKKVLKSLQYFGHNWDIPKPLGPVVFILSSQTEAVFL